MQEAGVMTGGEQAERGRIDTKIAVVLREDLEIWQKLNVTAFLASGVAATAPASIGEPYRDGSGTQYLPMFGQPVMVFAGSPEQVRGAYERALAREVVPSIFTADLFRTGNDIDNRAAVAAVAAADLDLVGIAFRADRRVADKVLKGLALHG
jgi:hypothetical protein